MWAERKLDSASAPTKLVLRARSCAGSNFRLIEFLPCLGTDFVQFGVQTPQFCVELEEGHAVQRDQLMCRHAGVILGATGLHTDASGRLLSPRIFLQAQKAKTNGLHGRIMAWLARAGSEYLLNRHQRNLP
jgi:hypothetical protein